MTGSNQTSTYPKYENYEIEFDRDSKKSKGIYLANKINNIKKCGIGKRYFDKTFSNYDSKNTMKAVNECKLYCKNFYSNFKEGKGLFLTGTVGTGKTHLIAGMVDYLARIYKRKFENFLIVYYSSTGLLNDIKNSYEDRKSDRVIDDIKYCTLLIVDDFGAEKTTDWVLETYFEIIDFRYANLRPTIIATNLTDKEIKEKLGERIMSRIFEMNKGIKLTGKDYRLEAH